MLKNINYRNNFFNPTKFAGVILSAIFVFSACNLIPNQPEEYFDKTALNANTVSRFGTDYFAGREYYLKNTGGEGIMSTAEGYIEFSTKRLEESIEKAKNLTPTTETKPMIDAALDLFNFTLESYKTDHLKIARMIDKKEPKEAINKAMKDLDEKSAESFAVKYDKLWEIAKKYAKDNNIKLTEMPRF